MTTEHLSTALPVEVYASGEEVQARVTPEHVANFIKGLPTTRGVYDGVALESDGVYISPAALQGEVAEVLPQFTGFQAQPGKQLTAGDSQNGVLFGDISVRVGEKDLQVQTAVKPFAEEPAKAGYEHDRLIEASQLGFDAFRPLALMKDGETNYLVTEFRDDVTTLDNVNWTISPSDPRYATEVLPSLHFIAEHMGETHGKGLFNGDPQVKNFAKSDVGNAVVMDLEYATVAQNTEDHATWLSGGYEIRDSRAYQDVKQFWFSLTRSLGTDSPNTFLQDESYETCVVEFENNFLEPYMRSLQKHLSPAVQAQVSLDNLREGIYQGVGTMM